MNKQITEQLRFIENLLRGHEEKSQKAYYSIKVERFGEFTLVVDRGYGAEGFINDIAGTLRTHKPEQVVIELYTTKSKRVKYPTNTYKIALDKKSGNPANITITKPGLFGEPEQPEIKPVFNQPQEFISLQQYIQETLNGGRVQIQLEFQVKTLEFDNKQKEAEILHLKAKLEQVQEELNEAYEEVAQQEKKILKGGGLGSVSLGMVGSSLVESFFKSKTGKALAISLLGSEKATQLHGIINSLDTGENSDASGENLQGVPKQNTARIIVTPEESPTEKTKTPSKKLEQYHLMVLKNIPRVDDMSVEEQVEYITKVLKKSDNSITLVFCQILIAFIKEPTLMRELVAFHQAVANQFNKIQDQKAKPQPVTPAPKDKDKGTGQTGEEEEDPDSDQEEDTPPI